MPPKGYRKPAARSIADYDRGIQLVTAIDRIAAILAVDFSDCPRTLLVTTALFDAHRELYDRRTALAKGSRAETSPQDGQA